MANKTAWYRDRDKMREYRQKERKIDKELGIRYHSWEQYPGESFSEFKKRLTGKTL